MYYLIGADGREYGPFTSEQIRDWVAEGRANAHSRVRCDGETTWQALTELAELADLVGRPAFAEPTPPPVLTPEAIALEYLGRNVVIDIGSCLRRGWALVRNNVGVLVGSTLLIWLVALGLSLLPLVGWFAGILVNPVLTGGLFYVFIRRIRGDVPSVGDALNGFSMAFLPLALAGLVSSLLTVLGFLLLILPGIYLMVGYAFALPLVIDKRMDFWTAMEVSRRVIHRQWWTMFGLTIVAISLVIGGVLLYLIGVLFTAPIAIAAMMYAYDDVFGRS